MSVKHGALALAGQREDHQRAPEYEERVRQKRLVASARRPSFGTQGVTSGLPASLATLAERVGESLRGADLLGKGWQPALVDLRRVCALLPFAFLDVELPTVEEGDFDRLAEILFAHDALDVGITYDPAVTGWVVHDATEDVQVVGQLRAAGSPGVVLGLVIGRSPFFIEVARVEDRFILVRGYDIAVSLLGRGVSLVPALVHRHRRPADLPFGRSSLEQAAVMGRRPPLLPDFLDDDVSAEVPMPRTQRLLMIRAAEFTA
jgi:hypothetical protein